MSGSGTVAVCCHCRYAAVAVKRLHFVETIELPLAEVAGQEVLQIQAQAGDVVRRKTETGSR